MRANSREVAQIKLKTSLPGPNATKWVEFYSKYAPLSTYLYPFVWDVAAWAEGPFCTDPDGNVFLDFYCHVASAPLGYNNKKILRDCGIPFDPIKTADHDTYTASGEDPFRPKSIPLPFKEALDFRTTSHLQEKLVKTASKFGFDKVFFVNSGAEAVSNAIKIALNRKYRELIKELGPKQFGLLCSQLGIGEDPHLQGLYTDYPIFGIACVGAFHGRTLDALSLTKSKKAQKEGFPTLRWIKHIPYNKADFDPDSLIDGRDLKLLIEKRQLARVVFEEGRVPAGLLAFVLAEPFLGEGGYIPGSGDFIKMLHWLAKNHNALYISDEIQAGLGRTGHMWAIEAFGVKPDLIVAAKGLRVGAVMGKNFDFPQQRGILSSTWAGGPMAAAVGYKTLEIIEEEKLTENARRMGAYLLDSLNNLRKKQPVITDLRGMGLMVGIELASAEKRDKLVEECFRRGFLTLGCGTRTLRLLPPLDVTRREIDMALGVLESAISSLS